MCYETAEGLVGEGRGGIWASGQSGLLWFFDRDNAEALVKVLDGCSYNGHRWVFVAPVTDLAFNLHVTSHNGRRWTHRNRLGMTAAARGDTSAFDCATDDGKAGVWVAPEALTFTAAGQTAQLAATVLDESGRVVEGAAVSWRSANPAVATVNAAGLVTAVGIGTTTVEARWGSLSGEAAVKVKGSPRVAVTPAIGTLARGDTLRLVAEAYDETGNAVEGAAFTWSSSRGSVATVDGSGLVRGVALGKVTITATLRSGGAEGSIERLSGRSELTVVTEEAHDRAVLVAFYEATGGPSWRRSDGWLTSAPAGDWYGVETDQSGRVVGLDLGAEFDLDTLYDYGDGLRLTGSIPPELGRLAGLESLNLRRNGLTGPIPPELGDLTNLTVLDLALNALRTIPPELGRLAKLEELNLFACGVRGSIPPELGRLARLKSLNLRANELRGSIPAELGRLASLRELDLSYNGFTELEPAVFVGLANLAFLDLSGNPGSPFKLTLRPERMDNEDLLAPGPARIRFGVTEGAPFRMTLPLAAAGGDLSAARVTIGAGSARSPEVTVTRKVEAAGGTQVASMAVPPLPEDFHGIEVGVEPVVLFRATAPTASFSTRSAAAPEGGTALLRLTLSEPAASAVTFTYSLGVDADPSTADASASDHAHDPRGSVQVAAGASSADIEISIVDDDELEPSREVLTVTLAPPGEETGYRLGYPHAATVVVEEGVCDRTPRIRDEILAHSGSANCADLDEYRLADIRYLQIMGPAASRGNGRGVRWTPQLVARVRAGECDMESLVADPAEAGQWVTCVGEGAQAEALRIRNDLANAEGGATVTSLHEDDFAGLSNLRVLWLRGLGLTELPSDVFSDLSGLDLLSLRDNQLTDLPPRVFSGLSRLRWLLLDRNSLTSLPSDIFSDLSGLEVLVLSENQLTAVPTRAFGGLSGLKSLFIWGNPLGTLEASAFSGLSDLRRLSMGSAELAVLSPGAFSGLERLETLLLTGNRLTDLPPGVFTGFRRLQRLRLDRNPGAPFPLTLELRRTDAADPRAPGPARLVLALEQGAPVNLRIPLSAHGGSISAEVVALGAGSSSSREVNATGASTGRSAMQVVAGPAPALSSYVRGVELRVADPLVLFGTASNRAPVPERPLPLLRLRVGSGAGSVDPSLFFRDPDGDGLIYTAAVDRPDVVSVGISGDNVRVEPVGPGRAAVAVTATDPGGLSAWLSLPVSVSGARPGLFDIDLIFKGDVPTSVRAAFDRAAEYWSAILAATELADVPLSGDFELGCLGITARTFKSSVDDLVIVASVSSIDGARRTIAYAAVCGIRKGDSGLPFMGAIAFDLDDAEWMTSRDLDEVILHEMGHVLGIGTLWSRFGLLRNPSLPLQWNTDTHFTGPLAITAFDLAGGTAYTQGEKVPVENRLGFGSGDSHWRDRVLDYELMTPTQNIGVADPLSAVTIQSLADLGYTVDVGLAEGYALPGAVAEEAAESVDKIEYGDDTPKVPMIVVDRTGRIVRTFPE